MNSMARGVIAALLVGAAANSAQAAPWTAVNDIVGQTSTATVAGGGNPLYIPPLPQYAGVVGLLMDYGPGGAFVCSGSLVSRRYILTAAHCVSDGFRTPGPLTTTAFFYNGPDDPAVYAAGSPATRIGISQIRVNSGYTGNVIDQNDIALLRLSDLAPSFAPVYELSDLDDLTGQNHIIAGYGARSLSGGANGTLPGFSLGAGRLRYAGNRFDFRYGDPDFGGFFEGFFGDGTADVDHVWISDFDNGTAFRDGSCNLPGVVGFSGGVFETSKYCDLGIGAFEGIGAGGDSGSPYFIDGKVAAVHSFAQWLRDDESANRFGQLKGAVAVYFHRDFIVGQIPTPGSWAMMALGLGAVAAMRRRAA